MRLCESKLAKAGVFFCPKFQQPSRPRTQNKEQGIVSFCDDPRQTQVGARRRCHQDPWQNPCLCCKVKGPRCLGVRVSFEAVETQRCQLPVSRSLSPRESLRIDWKRFGKPSTETCSMFMIRTDFTSMLPEPLLIFLGGQVSVKRRELQDAPRIAVYDGICVRKC